MRVLIKNGIVVNADGQAKQDLLIESGIVRQLGTDISPQPLRRRIDASGCYVFLAAWMSIRISILMSASRAVVMIFLPVPALPRGGTTTIIDHMGFGPNGRRLRHQLEVYRVVMPPTKQSSTTAFTVSFNILITLSSTKFR